MILVDSRWPILHFPPSMYEWVSGVMKRDAIVVFNKVTAQQKKKV